MQCDASKNDLGACLLQEGRPICYGSHTMSTAEENYAQVEKEALTIVFAMKRFHQFTYGRPTVVYSDQKPLEAIMKKPLCKAPLRLQKMLLRLQKYDVEVIYKPGYEMPDGRHPVESVSPRWQKTANNIRYCQHCAKSRSPARRDYQPAACYCKGQSVTVTPRYCSEWMATTPSENLCAHVY